MKTLRDRYEDKHGKPPSVVETAKGQQVAMKTRHYTSRGYRLESAVPQGRKRVVLTFVLDE